MRVAPLVLWGKVKTYIENKRPGRFRRLVESVLLVSSFGKTYAIKSFGTTAAIVNCAGIHFTGEDLLDKHFDQGGKFADWLRAINNDRVDEPCIDFLVTVLQGNNQVGRYVSRDNLEEILFDVDPTCAKHIIEGLVDDAAQLLTEVESDDEHEEVEGAIQRNVVKDLLQQDPNVAAVVRRAVKNTFSTHVPHAYTSRTLNKPGRRKKKAGNEHDATSEKGCCKTISAKLKPAYVAYGRYQPFLVTWLILIGCFVGRYFYWRTESATPNEPVAIAVAKGSGFSILIATCLVYLSKVPLFAWSRIVPWFWNNTSFHAHVGIALFAFTVVHVASHFIWQGRDAFITSTDNSTVDVSTAYDLSAAWLTATGLILTVIIFAISFTASRRRQHPSNYRSFLNVHNLYYIYLIVLIMHVPHRVYVLGALAGIFGIHQAMLRFVTSTGDMQKCSVIGTSTSRLLLNDHKKDWDLLGSMPGSYYEVMIPALSRLEWHPFSITTSRSGIQPEFFVESLGKWTNELKALLRKPKSELANTNMQVRGPFYSPAVNAVGENRPVCVAAGIGITPFLGILHHFVYMHSAMKIQEQTESLLRDRRSHMMKKRRMKSNNGSSISLAYGSSISLAYGSSTSVVPDSVSMTVVDDAEELDEVCQILWVVRDLTLANFLLPYVADLLSLQKGDDPETDHKPLVKVKVFCTGGGEGAKMDTMAMDALLLYHFGQQGQKDDDANKVLEFQLGRPDLNAELKRSKPSAVFYCGGPTLKLRVESACASINSPFYPEEFQDRTLSQWPKLWPTCCDNKKKAGRAPKQATTKRRRNKKSQKAEDDLRTADAATIAAAAAASTAVVAETMEKMMALHMAQTNAMVSAMKDGSILGSRVISPTHSSNNSDYSGIYPDRQFESTPALVVDQHQTTDCPSPDTLRLRQTLTVPVRRRGSRGKLGNPRPTPSDMAPAPAAPEAARNALQEWVDAAPEQLVTVDLTRQPTTNSDNSNAKPFYFSAQFPTVANLAGTSGASAGAGYVAGAGEDAHYAGLTDDGGLRAQQVSLFQHFKIGSASEMVDVLHNEGMEEIECLFGIASEDWELITALFKSNEIVHADCEAFRAMVNELEEASTKREKEAERAAKQQAIEDYANYASTHSNVATSQSDSEVDVLALSMERFIGAMSEEQLIGQTHDAELSHADPGLAFPKETGFLKKYLTSRSATSRASSDMGDTELSNTQVVKAKSSEVSTRVQSTPRARVEQQKDTFWRPGGSINTIV